MRNNNPTACESNTTHQTLVRLADSPPAKSDPPQASAAPKPRMEERYELIIKLEYKDRWDRVIIIECKIDKWL